MEEEYLGEIYEEQNAVILQSWAKLKGRLMAAKIVFEKENPDIEVLDVEYVQGRKLLINFKFKLNEKSFQ